MPNDTNNNVTKKITINKKIGAGASSEIYEIVSTGNGDLEEKAERKINLFVFEKNITHQEMINILLKQKKPKLSYVVTSDGIYHFDRQSFYRKNGDIIKINSYQGEVSYQEILEKYSRHNQPIELSADDRFYFENIHKQHSTDQDSAINKKQSVLRIALCRIKEDVFDDWVNKNEIPEIFPQSYNTYKKTIETLRTLHPNCNFKGPLASRSIHGYRDKEEHAGYLMRMPLIQGKNVNDYLTKNNSHLTVEKRHELMRAIILAIKRVHDHGMVHRDLKPENIMVRENPTTNVIEALVIDVDGAVREGEPVGMDGGTYAYLAPEVIPGTGKRHETYRANRKADMYALGKIFEKVYPGEESNIFSELCGGLLNNNPEVRPDINKTLVQFNDAIIASGLKQDDDRQPAIADPLIAAFEQSEQRNNKQSTPLGSYAIGVGILVVALAASVLIAVAAIVALPVVITLAAIAVTATILLLGGICFNAISHYRQNKANEERQRPSDSSSLSSISSATPTFKKTPPVLLTYLPPSTIQTENQPEEKKQTNRNSSAFFGESTNSRGEQPTSKNVSNHSPSRKNHF